MTRALRQLRSAARMDRASWALVVEATVALVAARLRSLLPFRLLARQLGGLIAPDTALPDRHLSEADRTRARRIRWAVAAVAPWLPFRALCLQQAIAARAMLDRRGIGSVLHLGVDRSAAAKLAAHAWLDAGGVEVTGYPLDPALTEVARFVSRA